MIIDILIWLWIFLGRERVRWRRLHYHQVVNTLPHCPVRVTAGPEHLWSRYHPVLVTPGATVMQPHWVTTFHMCQNPGAWACRRRDRSVATTHPVSDGQERWPMVQCHPHTLSQLPEQSNPPSLTNQRAFLGIASEYSKYSIFMNLLQKCQYEGCRKPTKACDG